MPRSKEIYLTPHLSHNNISSSLGIDYVEQGIQTVKYEFGVYFHA